MSLNLAQRFERYPLAYLPSPLHPLKRLSKELGVEVWAKRDDVSSGLAYGGNKVRKLEWLLPEAIRQGCDTLVSIGGVQSNHTRQVAAVAAVSGLRCRLVQEHWAEWEDPVYDKVGNILLSRLMGAQTLLEGEGYSTSVKDTWQRALEQVRREGGRPYSIPAGASDHPLGGLGYANFADEVAQQESQLGVFFDTIITATCTGSTQDRHRYGGESGDDPARRDEDRARHRRARGSEAGDPRSGRHHRASLGGARLRRSR